MATLVPDRVWLVDERGDLMFRDVDPRTNALARALRGRGVAEGSSMALMARNHGGRENAFPQEVEDCLARHQAVAEVAVTGVDDDLGKRLRAFVVLRDEARADEDQLQAHVRASPAGYKVPCEIVVLDELPRDATGKVLKVELADHDPGDPGDPDDPDGDRNAMSGQPGMVDA